MNICKGLCERFEAKNISGYTRYESGQKRCSQCSIFIIFLNARCPCCQTKLRLRSRLNKVQKKSRSDSLMKRY